MANSLDGQRHTRRFLSSVKTEARIKTRQEPSWRVSKNFQPHGHRIAQLQTRRLGTALCPCSGDKPGVWLGPSEHTPPENAAPGAPHTFILLPTGLAPFPQLPVESRIYSVIEFQPRFYGECNGVNFSNAGGSWKGSPVETQTWDSRQLSEKPLRSPLLAKMQPGRKLITQC